MSKLKFVLQPKKFQFWPINIYLGHKLQKKFVRAIGRKERITIPVPKLQEFQQKNAKVPTVPYGRQAPFCVFHVPITKIT